ncbi:MAG: universal stress protein [Rhodospirillales bacterium]|nr:universal stress protein [Rhodospirillales bacterium]
MNGPQSQRRILVAVDASPLSLAALEAAADLARRWQAELAALFVEDVNLLRLATHPGIEVLSLLSARRQPVDRAAFEDILRAQLARARRAVEAAALSRQVAFTFTVRRGRVEVEVLAAAEEADLLIAGWGGRGLGGGLGPPLLGSTARALAERASRPLFLLRERMGPVHAVLVAYDGSPASGRALALAAEIARRDGGAIDVLLPARAPAELEPAARAALAGGGLEIRCHALDASGLRGAARKAPGCVLVVAAPVGEDLGELPCSVVVVR